MRRILLTCLCLSWTLPGHAQSTASDDAGKALVERVCSRCHDLEGVFRSRNSKDGWTKVVDDMVSRGADASDPEIERIIDYLTTHFGRKVNVNKASASSLASTLAISQETAAAIVEYREKNGAFKEWDDLAKVPGLDLKQIADKKAQVEFGEK